MLAVALTVVLAVPGGEAQKPSREAIVAEKSHEFQALKQHATYLVMQMKAASRGTAKNDPKSAWSKLLADFDQWAQKFNVPTHEKTLPTEVTGPRGEPIHRDYPLVTQGPPGIAGYLCLKDLVRSTAAKCVYKCYRE